MFLYKTAEKNRVLSEMGIRHLYPWQEEVLSSVFNGNDVFLRAHTGSGKSLVFQLPAILEAGRALTMVFSPMRALQRDQVTSLRNLGVNAALLNSDLTASERQGVLENLPSTCLLCLAPEQLQSNESRELKQALKDCYVYRVVVDEAHVLPHYESGFRKAYSYIGEFIQSLPERPQIIACTATVTKDEQRKIVESLGMDDPCEYVYSVRRENLSLYVKKIIPSDAEQKRNTLEDNRFHSVERELEEWDGQGSVIIYCSTIRQVKSLHRYLTACGYKVRKCHGKMKNEKRSKACDAFLSGRSKLIVATNAFGLGIDKPDVRMIIHASPPLTIGDYVQEIGRAGRDGKKAKCVLFYSPSDFSDNERILRQNDKEAADRELKGLHALKDLLTSTRCLWKEIEKYYGDRPGDSCGKCCNCREKKYGK